MIRRQIIGVVLGVFFILLGYVLANLLSEKFASLSQSLHLKKQYFEAERYIQTYRQITRDYLGALSTTSFYYVLSHSFMYPINYYFYIPISITIYNIVIDELTNLPIYINNITFSYDGSGDYATFIGQNGEVIIEYDYYSRYYLKNDLSVLMEFYYYSDLQNRYILKSEDNFTISIELSNESKISLLGLNFYLNISDLGKSPYINISNITIYVSCDNSLFKVGNYTIENDNFTKLISYRFFEPLDCNVTNISFYVDWTFDSDSLDCKSIGPYYNYIVFNISKLTLDVIINRSKIPAHLLLLPSNKIHYWKIYNNLYIPSDDYVKEILKLYIKYYLTNPNVLLFGFNFLLKDLLDRVYKYNIQLNFNSFMKYFQEYLSYISFLDVLSFETKNVTTLYQFDQEPWDINIKVNYFDKIKELYVVFYGNNIDLVKGVFMNTSYILPGGFYSVKANLVFPTFLSIKSNILKLKKAAEIFLRDNYLEDLMKRFVFGNYILDFYVPSIKCLNSTNPNYSFLVPIFGPYVGLIISILAAMKDYVYIPAFPSCVIKYGVDQLENETLEFLDNSTYFPSEIKRVLLVDRGKNIEIKDYLSIYYKDTNLYPIKWVNIIGYNCTLDIIFKNYLFPVENISLYVDQLGREERFYRSFPCSLYKDFISGALGYMGSVITSFKLLYNYTIKEIEFFYKVIPIDESSLNDIDANIYITTYFCNNFPCNSSNAFISVSPEYYCVESSCYKYDTSVGIPIENNYTWVKVWLNFSNQTFYSKYVGVEFYLGSEGLNNDNSRLLLDDFSIKLEIQNYSDIFYYFNVTKNWRKDFLSPPYSWRFFINNSFRKVVEECLKKYLSIDSAIKNCIPSFNYSFTFLLWGNYSVNKIKFYMKKWFNSTEDFMINISVLDDRLELVKYKVLDGHSIPNVWQPIEIEFNTINTTNLTVIFKIIDYSVEKKDIEFFVDNFIITIFNRTSTLKIEECKHIDEEAYKVLNKTKYFFFSIGKAKSCNDICYNSTSCMFKNFSKNLIVALFDIYKKLYQSFRDVSNYVQFLSNRREYKLQDSILLSPIIGSIKGGLCQDLINFTNINLNYYSIPNKTYVYVNLTSVNMFNLNSIKIYNISDFYNLMSSYNVSIKLNIYCNGKNIFSSNISTLILANQNRDFIFIELTPELCNKLLIEFIFSYNDKYKGNIVSFISSYFSNYNLEVFYILNNANALLCKINSFSKSYSTDIKKLFDDIIVNISNSISEVENICNYYNYSYSSCNFINLTKDILRIYNSSLKNLLSNIENTSTSTWFNYILGNDIKRGFIEFIKYYIYIINETLKWFNTTYYPFCFYSYIHKYEANFGNLMFGDIYWKIFGSEVYGILDYNFININGTFYSPPECSIDNGRWFVCLSSSLDSCGCLVCNEFSDKYYTYLDFLTDLYNLVISYENVNLKSSEYNDINSFIDKFFYFFENPLKDNIYKILNVVDNIRDRFLHDCKMIYGNSTSCPEFVRNYVDKLIEILWKYMLRKVSEGLSESTIFYFDFYTKDLIYSWEICNMFERDPYSAFTINLYNNKFLILSLLFGVKDDITLKSILCG